MHGENGLLATLTVGYTVVHLFESAFCPSIITHQMHFCQLDEEGSSREEVGSQSRGGSRIFLLSGAPVRNAMTDWCGKQKKFKSEYKECFILERGGGCAPPVPSP